MATFKRTVNDKQRAHILARRAQLAAQLAAKPRVQIYLDHGTRHPGANHMAWHALKNGGHAPPTGKKGYSAANMGKKGRAAFYRTVKAAGKWVRYTKAWDLGISTRDKDRIWEAAVPLRQAALTGNPNHIVALLAFIGRTMCEVLKRQVPRDTGEMKSSFRFLVRRGMSGAVEQFSDG